MYAQRMYAQLSGRGTPCAETAMCDKCVRDGKACHTVAELALQRTLSDIDKPRGAFVECSKNESLVCVWCGTKCKPKFQITELLAWLNAQEDCNE